MPVGIELWRRDYSGNVKLSHGSPKVLALEDFVRDNEQVSHGIKDYIRYWEKWLGAKGSSFAQNMVPVIDYWKRMLIELQRPFSTLLETSQSQAYESFLPKSEGNHTKVHDLSDATIVEDKFEGYKEYNDHYCDFFPMVDVKKCNFILVCPSDALYPIWLGVAQTIIDKEPSSTTYQKLLIQYWALVCLGPDVVPSKASVGPMPKPPNDVPEGLQGLRPDVVPSKASAGPRSKLPNDVPKGPPGQGPDVVPSRASKGPRLNGVLEGSTRFRFWLDFWFCNVTSSGSGSGSILFCYWSGSGSDQDFKSGSGPSAGTQDSATQDPHIAASDSSSDFDVMERYPMQQHPESSSQDMHVLGQQSCVSMFSRLKETLSRATRSEHATNEINEGGGEVDLPFSSQIDPVLSESVHVSTPATTPIGLSKLTPSETLLPDGRSFAEVQEVKRYILAAREKKIKSLRKAEQRRATLAKAPMTSANPLQSPELTILKSQPIESHIASGSKDTSNASILDRVFLNEN
ncbi:hypothetical protein L7F22_002048 [Adiantum nelumboides]|nr:hypothetical protein [Adiantum nelumboides]